MTTRSLRIAEGLSLPLDTVTQTIAILAKRRAGKSYTMRRLTEQLFAAGQQVVLVDPKGDQWGVRSAADGKGPGLPIVILGGEHGDAPLEVSAGAVVAKLVVEERVSVVLDLSTFRKGDVARFMGGPSPPRAGEEGFLEALYRLKAKEQFRTPMMLVIDEADAIAPQKPQAGEERMLGAAEDIVRRGGQRGIGCVFVTQRSAVLNKNVLTQAQILVALRTIAPQDLAAMNAWIDVHGTVDQKKTLMESLPSLPVGDAWVWSPGWPTEEGIFKRVHVLPIETFDSGKSPTPGVKPVEPKKAADVDLEALKRQMAATIEKAKADDPRELRKQIADLKRQLSSTTISKATERQTTSTRPVLTDADRALLEKLANGLGNVSEFLRLGHAQLATEAVDRLTSILEQFREDSAADIAKMRAEFVRRLESKGVQKIFDKLTAAGAAALPPVRPARAELRGGVPPTPRPGRPAAAPADSFLGKGERRVLTAVAQYPAGVTREQLTVLTSYTRSSRNTYIQRLGAAGLVDVTGDRICATPAGIATLGDDFEPLPTGDALREYWLDRLPEGERRILDELCRAYPDEVDRESLSASTNYTRSSRNTYLQRLGAKELIVTTRGGSVRASKELFS